MWLDSTGVAPAQCAKCRSRKWNTGKDWTIEKGQPAIQSGIEPPEPATGLEAVKARFGIKTASELMRGEAEQESAQPPRPFNINRPGWYRVVRRNDYGEALEDKLTGQVWLHCAGRRDATPYDTVSKALEALDDLEVGV
jgi:hypothetical protein